MCCEIFLIFVRKNSNQLTKSRWLKIGNVFSVSQAVAKNIWPKQNNNQVFCEGGNNSKYHCFMFFLNPNYGVKVPETEI